jgi:ribonuclease M5
LIKVKEAVIVEGKYDKIKLSSIIDGLIIETRGFQIFSDKKQMDLIRRLADTRGILILTDSDGAGFIIRNYLTGAIAAEKIKHAYIPDILGKENRKEKPSKEGKLGVEGVPAQAIRDALSRAGVVCGNEDIPAGRKITKTDLYLAGLSGREDSAQKRQELFKELSLPEHLATNSLVGVLNSIMSYDEFCNLVDKLFKKTYSKG